MSALSEIGKLVASFDPGRDRALLAEVVGVEGSHFRSPGSRLLLSSDGRRAGGISAGCLEADLERRFEELESGLRPRLLVYDLGSDDDLLFGTGLGCGGRIEVLVERIDLRLHRLLRFAASILERGERCTLVTNVSRSGRTARRALYERAGSFRGAASPRGWSRCELESGEILLTDVIEPAPRVWVCGSGADAVYLARSMASLGWRVRVVSSRDPETIARRFTESAILVLTPGDAAAELGTESFEAAVVMTHNFLDDLGCLEVLAGRPLAYLGVVGPRARTGRLFQSAGFELESNADLGSKLRSPAGLDLGAETPEEIALSIAAELTAAFRGAAATPLNGRSGKVHATSRSSTLLERSA